MEIRNYLVVVARVRQGAQEWDTLLADGRNLVAAFTRALWADLGRNLARTKATTEECAVRAHFRIRHCMSRTTFQQASGRWRRADTPRGEGVHF